MGKKQSSLTDIQKANLRLKQIKHGIESGTSLNVADRDILVRYFQEKLFDFERQDSLYDDQIKALEPLIYSLHAHIQYCEAKFKLLKLLQHADLEKQKILLVQSLMYQGLVADAAVVSDLSVFDTEILARYTTVLAENIQFEKTLAALVNYAYEKTTENQLHWLFCITILLTENAKRKHENLEQNTYILDELPAEKVYELARLINLNVKEGEMITNRNIFAAHINLHSLYFGCHPFKESQIHIPLAPDTAWQSVLDEMNTFMERNNKVAPLNHYWKPIFKDFVVSMQSQLMAAYTSLAGNPAYTGLFVETSVIMQDLNVLWLSLSDEKHQDAFFDDLFLAMVPGYEYLDAYKIEPYRSSLSFLIMSKMRSNIQKWLDRLTDNKLQTDIRYQKRMAKKAFQNKKTEEKQEEKWLEASNETEISVETESSPEHEGVIFSNLNAFSAAKILQEMSIQFGTIADDKDDEVLEFTLSSTSTSTSTSRDVSASSSLEIGSDDSSIEISFMSEPEYEPKSEISLTIANSTQKKTEFDTEEDDFEDDVAAYNYQFWHPTADASKFKSGRPERHQEEGYALTFSSDSNQLKSKLRENDLILMFFGKSEGKKQMRLKDIKDMVELFGGTYQYNGKNHKFEIKPQSDVMLKIYAMLEMLPDPKQRSAIACTHAHNANGKASGLAATAVDMMGDLKKQMEINLGISWDNLQKLVRPEKQPASSMQRFGELVKQFF